MQDVRQTRADFSRLLLGIMAIYGKDISQAVTEIWWNALRKYEIEDVTRAFNQHAVNPDTGQYPPKPADIVRYLDGSTLTSAMLAWTKVYSAIKHVGPYQTIAFDDAIIHAVISDMGGWIYLCDMQEEEQPFKAREFEKRYQGYSIRGHCFNYPGKLIGLAEAYNSSDGHSRHIPDVVMIGDSETVQQVLSGGDGGTVKIKRLTDKSDASKDGEEKTDLT